MLRYPHQCLPEQKRWMAQTKILIAPRADLSNAEHILWCSPFEVVLLRCCDLCCQLHHTILICCFLLLLLLRLLFLLLLAFDWWFIYTAHCRSRNSMWPSPRSNCVEDTRWQGDERSGLQRSTHTMLMATVPPGSCCIWICHNLSLHGPGALASVVIDRGI